MPSNWLKQVLKLKEGQVDATRVEKATLAAKIRKLAMYAQQLAETGMKGGQVDALRMEVRWMLSEWRWTAIWRPRSGS
jgi:hypothetical protein